MTKQEPLDASVPSEPEYPQFDGVIIRHRQTPPAPVFINALGSRNEPGETAYLFAQNLLNSLHAERIVTFDSDRFVNYFQQRPMITIEQNRLVGYHTDEIAIDLLRDDEGRQLALLHGPEPALAWNLFSHRVIELVKEFGSELAIGVHAMPMALPHTRPVQLVAHANRCGLGMDDEVIELTAQWPASMVSALEYQFGQADIAAIGFGAGIPFYIAQHPYPQAAAELVRRISQVSGLALPFGDLEAASLHVTSAINVELAGAPGMEQMLHSLETNFDERSKDGPKVPSWGSSEVPSAEEIGAAAEAFLADFASGTGLPRSVASAGGSPDSGLDLAVDSGSAVVPPVNPDEPTADTPTPPDQPLPPEPQ